MKKLITYFACPFEQSTDGHTQTGWQKKIVDSFDKRKIYCYLPAEQESAKTGMDLVKHIDDTHVKFIQKKYKELEEGMNGVWYDGKECPKSPIGWMYDIMIHKDLGSGRTKPEQWGDFEAVLRSDFIIARIPVGSFTVGAYFEILTAMLFKIPVYLIIPGMKHKSRLDKSKLFNKTLFMAVCNSGGKWFWDEGSCINFIKKEWRI